LRSGRLVALLHLPVENGRTVPAVETLKKFARAALEAIAKLFLNRVWNKIAQVAAKTATAN
jgi:hypothetical protein